MSKRKGRALLQESLCRRKKNRKGREDSIPHREDDSDGGNVPHGSPHSSIPLSASAILRKTGSKRS